MKRAIFGHFMGGLITGNLREMDKELEEFKKLHKFYLYSDYRTKDIAKRLNVSPRTIQRWLKGKTKPNEEKLRRIREYLAEKKKIDIDKDLE